MDKTKMITVLLSWTVHLTNYPLPDNLPLIEYRPHEFFVEHACFGNEKCKVAGWYDDIGTIYLDDRVENKMRGPGNINCEDNRECPDDARQYDNISLDGIINAVNQIDGERKQQEAAGPQAQQDVKRLVRFDEFDVVDGKGEHPGGQTANGHSNHVPVLADRAFAKSAFNIAVFELSCQRFNCGYHVRVS